MAFKKTAFVSCGCAKHNSLNDDWCSSHYALNILESLPKRIGETLKKTYPHLSLSQIDQIIMGLKTYFYRCNSAGPRQMVAMPSQAVDVAWHEFILFTKVYKNFCQKGLGRFLHHTPAEAMEHQIIAQLGIKNAWRYFYATQKIKSAID